MLNRTAAIVFAAAVAAAAATTTHAAGIQSGDLVVLRVGDGNETLANTGNSTFLDEYSTAGVNRNNSVAIPDSGATSLIISGTASSEGAISISPDGKTIAVSGYNTPQATSSSSVTGTTSTAVPRASGSVNTTTGAFTLAGTYGSDFSANNIRSSVSNGSTTWGVGANTGVALADNSGTVVSTTSTNNRVINIINGNLFFSSGSGTKGIYEITGTPTVSGQTASVVIPETGSPYGFAINAAGTVAYIADDGSATTGVEKWVNNAGTWTDAYNFTVPTSGAGTGDLIRGLAVDWATNTIYATGANSGNTASDIFKAVDTGSTATLTEIAASGTGTIFRGLVLVPSSSPVPEPASLGILSLSGLLLLKRRR